MKPEEETDRLIEARLHGDAAHPQDADEQTRLEVVDRLLSITLDETAVPEGFAQRLEQRLLAHNQEIAATRRQRGSALFGWQRQFTQISARRRMLMLIGGASVALILVGVLIVQTSPNSIPGDVLYPVKVWEQSLQLAQAPTDADHARLEIQDLHTSIADLRQTIAQHRSHADILAAFTRAQQLTHDAQTVSAAIPPGGERDAVQMNLQSTLREERATLRQLLPSVDWGVQVAFTTQLGMLGEIVPSLQQVVITFAQDHHYALTIYGADFLPGVRVVIDGQSFIPPTSSTTTLLTVANVSLSQGTVSLGILNVDGTAAATTLQVPQGPQQPGTPGTSITPSPQDHAGSNQTPQPGNQQTPGPGEQQTPGPNQPDQTATPNPGIMLPTPTATPPDGQNQQGGKGRYAV